MRLEEEITTLEDLIKSLEWKLKQYEIEKEQAKDFASLYVASRHQKEEEELTYYVTSLKKVLKDFKIFCFLEIPTEENKKLWRQTHAYFTPEVYQFHTIIRGEILFFLDAMLKLRENKKFLHLFQKNDYMNLSFLQLLNRYFLEYEPKEVAENYALLNKQSLEEKKTYPQYQEAIQILKLNQKREE